MITERRSLCLGEGVGADVTVDPKFKSNSVTVRFLTKYDDKTAAALSLLPSLLTSFSADYPDSAVLSRKLNSLYGSWTSGSSHHRGGIYETVVSISYLRDRFALSGDKVSEEAISLFLGCIFNPAIENGGFIEEEFNIRKTDLLNSVDGEINDKVSYSLSNAYKTAFKGEPCAERAYHSREDAEALTPQFVYEVYLKLLKTAKIEISFCGGGDFERPIELFRQAFSYKRAYLPPPEFYSPSPIKPEPEYSTMRLEVKQADLVLIFKTRGADRLSCELLSRLYGGTPFSKLFMNVRERLSLCYFCSSSYLDSKGAITVVGGVAPENIEKAKDEILRQLEEIKSGNFTDEELYETKLAAADHNRSVYDSLSRLGEWYYVQKLKNAALSPDEHTAEILKLTREDMISAAKSLRLDTVFVLTERESRETERI